MTRPTAAPTASGQRQGARRVDRRKQGPGQEGERQEPAGELVRRRRAGDQAEEEGPSPARPAIGGPGDGLGEGEDRGDPEGGQGAVIEGVMPVGEEPGLQGPGPRRGQGRPGPETSGEEGVEPAPDEAEEDHRPDSGAGQGLPGGGEAVSRQGQQGIEGRVPVRLLAGEGPEVVEDGAGEELRAGVDLGGGRPADAGGALGPSAAGRPATGSPAVARPGGAASGRVGQRGNQDRTRSTRPSV